MGKEKSNKNYRQIRTTLPKEYADMLDKLCKKRVKKEAELVREALVKFLGSTFSDEEFK